jgi:hypothetical protein
MSTETTAKTYHVANSEKCFRFKPDAFCNHAPTNKGIYELVTFDENQNPIVLFVGAAFDQGILASLEAHAAGTLKPTSDEIFAAYPNLYFDYLTEMDAKSQEDAQDIYWWLVQKHKPRYNDVAGTKNSGRYLQVDVVEAG